ncbi:protein LTO1 homolog [Impatiens glandulifera]|uniref:protein LTO1 homolog n=1 Tax=Impatiens glandulifera TaxID=253017 RepID=UPI001FB173DB|nr:protein LTO1 homolog [Impatiens glandulifera]
MESHPRNSEDDDVFDFSNLEVTHVNDGHNEGYKEGLTLGKEEGRQVGLKHGFQIGEELGFYRGCVDIWKSAFQLDPACFSSSSRVQKSIYQMDELVRDYPLMDPEEETVNEIMDSLRLKFRSICATLNVKLQYNGYPKAVDAKNVEF